MGLSNVPANLESAVEAFVARRDVLEHEFGVTVDRALEREVRQGIARVLGDGHERRVIDSGLDH
jgi:hypothetical protein